MIRWSRSKLQMIIYQKRNGIQSRPRDIRTKISKKNLHIFSAANAMKPHKLPFFVFSKLKDPTTLKKIDNLSSPVCYCSQKSACWDSVNYLVKAFAFSPMDLYTKLTWKISYLSSQRGIDGLVFLSLCSSRMLSEIILGKDFGYISGKSSTGTLDCLLKNHLKLANSWIMFIM